MGFAPLPQQSLRPGPYRHGPVLDAAQLYFRCHYGVEIDDGSKITMESIIAWNLRAQAPGINPVVQLNLSQD